MSFSFSATGADKAAALQAVKDQMVAVVKDQPIHAKDQAFVNEMAAGALALLPDDASKDIGLSVYGSVGWEGENGKEELTSVSTGVSASLNARPKPVS